MIIYNIPSYRVYVIEELIKQVNPLDNQSTRINEDLDKTVLLDLIKLIQGMKAAITQDLNRAILKVDYLENHSWRNNLCFDGIPEDPNETWMATEHKVKQILTDHLDVKTEDFSISSWL